MIECTIQRILRRRLCSFSIVLSGLMLCGAALAQDSPARSSDGMPSQLPSPGLLTQLPKMDFSDYKAVPAKTHDVAADDALPVARSAAAVESGAPRRITLEEAQQVAAANDPMAHLAQLSVEAAHQHTLGAEADYFPKLSSTLTNFHFNKFMGQEVTVQRPIHGGFVTAALPLAGKDQTLIAVTAAQPITPIFKLRQVVELSRADEQVARAKAGMPVEIARNVETAYFGLLVAQRELSIARTNEGSIRNKRLVASTATPPAITPANEVEEAAAAKDIVVADSKVKELTSSLNMLLGLPSETQLELVTPTTPMEEISLKEASDAAMAANPEVVEAEANVMKAHAADKLAKLDYVPDIIVMGGYAYNDQAVPLLPTDFSFVGIMGSYTLFDFGKREHTLKERNAQVSMAETALALTKAKVAGQVRNTFFDLERSRQLSELAHRLSADISLDRVDYSKDDPELASSRAKVDLEMLQADLEYRQSLAQLKILMGER